MRTAGVPMSSEVYEVMFYEDLSAAAEAAVTSPDASSANQRSSWGKVEGTFQAMIDDNVQPPVHVHTLRVASYARMGMPEEAEAALHALRAAFAEEAEKAAAAAEVADHASKSLLKPLTLAQLIAEQWQASNVLFTKRKVAEEQGAQPKPHVEEERAAWERVMAARRTHAMQAVKALGAAEEQPGFRAENSKNASRFSGLVKEHVQKGQLEAAETTLEVMRIATLTPVPDAFEVLVTAHGRAHDWERMEATMQVRMGCMSVVEESGSMRLCPQATGVL